MAHQANAVHQEIDVVGVSGRVHHLQPRLVDLRAYSTGLDDLHGSALCRLDL